MFSFRNRVAEVIDTPRVRTIGIGNLLVLLWLAVVSQASLILLLMHVVGINIGGVGQALIGALIALTVSFVIWGLVTKTSAYTITAKRRLKNFEGARAAGMQIGNYGYGPNTYDPNNTYDQ